MNDVRREYNTVRGLLDHPGWKWYVEEVLLPAINNHQDIVLNAEDDSAMVVWRARGAYQALREVLEAPEAAMDYLDRTLKNT